MRWLLLALCVVMIGCIPVTIHPQFGEDHKPIPLAVTPVGSISPDGTLNPVFPTSSSAPSEFNWGSIGAVIGAITTALLAAYGINVRGTVTKLKNVATIAMNLADANGTAETDDEVKKNKDVAKQMQVSAGVHDLTKALRGK